MYFSNRLYINNAICMTKHFFDWCGCFWIWTIWGMLIISVETLFACAFNSAYHWSCINIIRILHCWRLYDHLYSARTQKLTLHHARPICIMECQYHVQFRISRKRMLDIRCQIRFDFVRKAYILARFAFRIDRMRWFLTEYSQRLGNFNV